MARGRIRRPRLPGEILTELYLEPYEIDLTQLSKASGLSRKLLSQVVNGHARITARTAVRIATVVGTTPDYWLKLQNAVDIYDEQRRLSGQRPRLIPEFLEKEAPPMS